jgi:uncharacterized phosphosugar-binding protein
MYAERIARLVADVTESQAVAVRQAADLVTGALMADGIIQAFGSGHSESIAMEIAGRAGGLVPSNRLSLRDLVLVGGASVQILNPELERDPTVAQRLYDLYNVAPQDVFVLISSSGVNGSTVELADLVKSRGHGLVAITSVLHSTEMTSRHPSGRKLMHIADVVLDNRSPYGDSVIPLPGGGAYGAVSTITSALLVQLMVEQVVSDLLAAGITPPVYLSANMVGGDDHNARLEARYAGRIRRTA